jgi:hypothetical protein
MESIENNALEKLLKRGAKRVLEGFDKRKLR